jgi:opacity protein-like surface antigen
MRHLTLLAAASALALATPAYAAGHGYVGFDAGLLMPDDVDFEYDSSDAFTAELNNGFDLDLIGGYDFGFIRLEGELGWKRASHHDYSDGDVSLDADGDTDVRSIMLNGLGDFGTDKWSFYAGGGVGYAWVRNGIEFEDAQQVPDDNFSLKDSAFAYQLIAGVRYSVNEIIDIGLKYRYFDTSDMSDDDLDFDFTSHSIMFSFIYNMGGERYVAPPPPPPMMPPPPPPPPATQTCPDGSVILATDACPPPPPPPPPPPEPERG